MNEITPAAKLCECGCGAPAPIATSTHRPRGYVRGEPVRFIQGHGQRGKPKSDVALANMATSRKRGPQAWNWRGEDLGYYALHRYLRDHFPKSGVCSECGGSTRRTEWALIRGRSYSRDIQDYRELCRECHMIYDGQKKPNTGQRHPDAPAKSESEAT